MRYSVRLIVVEVGQVGQRNVRPLGDVELVQLDIHPERSVDAIEHLARAAQAGVKKEVMPWLCEPY